MGGNFGTWFPKLHFDSQPSHLNSFGIPLDMGPQNLISSTHTNDNINMVMPNGALPVTPEGHQFWTGHGNESHSWFYSFPKRAIPYAPNSFLKDKLSIHRSEVLGESTALNTGSGCAQKRFLVFDQTGDQRTSVFQCLMLQSPGSLGADNFHGEYHGIKGNSVHPLSPAKTGDLNKYPESELQSEVHENTEELNALLYSDGESDSDEDDDEVTSTGHSPSTMTSNYRQGWFDGINEKVASSCGPTKKRKIYEGSNNDRPSLTDHLNSLKANGPLDLEEDAESSCGNEEHQDVREVDTVSSYRKMSKEKFLEIISTLQSIVPNSKGKEAIVVLDEAIQYLNSLKFKAMALGLNSKY